MRGWVVGLPMAALAFAGTVEAAPSDARRTITNPDWLTIPTAEQMEDSYPKVAQFLSLDGHATIICEVTAQGATETCTVESEVPLGMRFGEAAVALSGYFKMRPMTVDGTPVAGGRVRVPIHFIFPHADDETALIPDADPPTAPSAKALELARRIVSANFSADAMKAYVEATRQAVDKQFIRAGLTPEEQAGIDDYMAALAAAMPSLAEAKARRLARRLHEADLAVIDAFVESTAGRAFTALAMSEAKENESDQDRLWATVRKEASAAYCAKHPCVRPYPAATSAKP
jgi:hypothetical protein